MDNMHDVIYLLASSKTTVADLLQTAQLSHIAQGELAQLLQSGWLEQLQSADFLQNWGGLLAEDKWYNA